VGVCFELPSGSTAIGKFSSRKRPAIKQSSENYLVRRQGAYIGVRVYMHTRTLVHVQCSTERD